ncbi:hypothetical protein DICSQDRAFT_184152 [Dichomitus squalens LYAD-421 SS1]|uniref:F-box domain-containing protein n=2 Tax=Dichomitus squalens TaxID=114155 RepID=A0A4V2JYS1_9APHY|nr:uncharacterized protein DICSQDRAFT_184152 [Dichomitus squalens LYAD-421 SS1]EJF55859.1 hypothetical protein DICSQDRAFT_184152 [Dichomitus squalens LYAD-421 SS1]TBU22243.1 hypothetical protein BD311DRAFT_811641 [Dichomitus squalens]
MATSQITPPICPNRNEEPPKTLVPFSALNNDVLHEIASHLSGRDALNFALTCRCIHDLAIHRVSCTLFCKTAADLRRARLYHLQGLLRRAIFLRSLSIADSVFIDRPWQDDLNWADPKTTYEYSLATLVGDILEAAQNLNHLRLEHFAHLVRHEPRIRDAVAAMTHLAGLELSEVDVESLDIFRDLRSDLHYLQISTDKWSKL